MVTYTERLLKALASIPFRPPKPLSTPEPKRSEPPRLDTPAAHHPINEYRALSVGDGAHAYYCRREECEERNQGARRKPTPQADGQAENAVR
jgi:hypothetical protein